MLESDVSPFAIILCELLSGEPGFSRHLSRLELMKNVIADHTRPSSPNLLCNTVKQLILDCWADKPTSGRRLWRFWLG
jgi:hypothetical protein